jgi:hypothetical protein
MVISALIYWCGLPCINFNRYGLVLLIVSTSNISNLFIASYSSYFYKWYIGIFTL